MGVLVLQAQKFPYDLAAVPDSIKNKANVVVHLDNTEVNVESDDKVTVNIHKVYTVLNDEGKGALFFQEFSTKYIFLEEVEIKVFDANGKQTEKVRKKDLRTLATGEGLIEDGFRSYYTIKPSAYPVTVELKYEQKLKSTLNLPDFRYITVNEGVVSASYQAKVNPEIGIRFKAKNTTIQPVITQDGKYAVYKWSVSNLPPAEQEERSIAMINRFPHVSITADKFSHYGYKGDMSSWNSFGLWLRDLHNGLDALPADRQQFFQQMVSDVKTDQEKIRRIYKYLQENFRYVSIQLGIGGWKSFAADFTDKKKYGDCKGLSNYMKAALKAVGINSHLAIINAAYNQEPVDQDFPANGFNHMILCVPGQKDSIWLECTSNLNEMGELGTFTENRNALLVTDKGGVLVPTPRSEAGKNSWSAVSTITIQDDLSALCETKFKARGEYRELMDGLLKETKDMQKQAIVSYLGAKQPDDFLLTKIEDPELLSAELKMVISKIPEFNAGNKLFFSPRLFKTWTGRPLKQGNRKSDYFFEYPFERSDTTIFKLPAGAVADALPSEKHVSCDFATYQSKYWFSAKENAIYATTSLVLKQHRIPAKGYASLKKFFDDLMQDDSQRIVVQKTDVPNKGEKKAF
ncbi:MAG: DUF3857 domain-containing protein [Chitinophagaceae bacterium]|nr:DUF3857 domain-containing protein [Chitinophagaceae bacterium]